MNKKNSLKAALAVTALVVGSFAIMPTAAQAGPTATLCYSWTTKVVTKKASCTSKETKLVVSLGSITGAAGAAGATGPAGAAGAAGVAGLPGVAGAAGAAGATGPAGPSGGPAGPAGADGVAGLPGVAGAAGAAGADGVAGVAGAAGAAGAAGVGLSQASVGQACSVGVAPAAETGVFAWIETVTGNKLWVMACNTNVIP